MIKDGCSVYSIETNSNGTTLFVVFKISRNTTSVVDEYLKVPECDKFPFYIAFYFD